MENVLKSEFFDMDKFSNCEWRLYDQLKTNDYQKKRALVKLVARRFERNEQNLKGIQSQSWAERKIVAARYLGIGRI